MIEARKILNDYFDNALDSENEALHIAKIRELFPENNELIKHLYLAHDKGNTKIKRYKQMIEACSDEQLEFIIRFTKRRREALPVHDCYRIMLDAVNTRRVLDNLVSGNYSNYSKKPKAIIKKLQDDIEIGIEAPKHTKYIPKNREDIDEAISNLLKDCLAPTHITAFKTTLNLFFS